MKTLYFEGAGCVPRGEVENCRIRTAFHTDAGEAIYLEILSEETGKHSSPISKEHAPYAGWIDSCAYIVYEDGKSKYHNIVKQNHVVIDYNYASILQFVNSVGCSFDNVVVLPNLAGYRVFADIGDNHNFGDEFVYDHGRTIRAEQIRKHYYELEQAEGKKNPNFSLWVDPADNNALCLLRHFNGYNREWRIINQENWLESVREVEIKKSPIVLLLNDVHLGGEKRANI